MLKVRCYDDPQKGLIMVASSEFIERINIVVRDSCKNIEKESANLYKNFDNRLSPPEFLELFVWNIVVPFSVNMLATYVSNLLRSNPLDNEIKKLREEIETLRSEILDRTLLVDKDKCLITLNKANDSFSSITQSPISCPDLAKYHDTGIEAATRLLIDYGWPPDIAKRRAIEMSDIFKEKFEK